MDLKLPIFLLVLVTLSKVIAKSYDNYKVYSVEPKSEEQVQILTDLRMGGYYDYWTDSFGIGNDVRIMVEPEKAIEFVNYTKSVGLDAVMRISNVQELIAAQLHPAQNVHRNSLGSFSWDRYHSIEQIHSWLDELEELYPGVVTTVTIGTTFEGRSIKGVIINFNADNRQAKPLIGMIEGGVHAREWISPATVTWIIKEFLTSTDTEVRSLSENFIWHIIPVANPDGYSHSFKEDRMWRKNRNTDNFRNCSISNDLSNGVDLNRNFNYLWMTVGASSDPCAQTYAGPSAGSEKETQAISNYVLKLKQEGNFIYYLGFHSFSQMILIPYSHVQGWDVLEAPNYPDLYEIAIRGAEKLEATHGTQYRVGTSAEILYETSGSSFDWVKGVAEVPIVYLFELRDLGDYGFLLPPEQIIPNNEEIMECLIDMDRSARLLRYYSGASTTVVSLAPLVFSVGLMMILQ